MSAAVRAGGRLWLQLAATFLAAGAITTLVVLPAEYGIDLTGFGRLVGLERLSRSEVAIEARAAPLEIARTYPTPFRTDTIRIHLGGLEDNYGQMEYKISMQAGETLVYAWSASHALDYEFHGHTLKMEHDSIVNVMTYEAGNARAVNGAFSAPIDGIHGWYFLNRQIDTPVDIEISLGGYYRLEPGELRGR